jgi:uncharacterized protein (TIGR02646 family)
MIFIKRITAPEIFTRKNSPAQAERKKAEAYFSGAQLPEKPFPFKFYSSRKDEYKEELLKMFNSRCAYCECFVTVGNRGDIEHFRPKGEFTTLKAETIKPGYYWLASDWENLYLSCTNCNQSTTFKILDANNPGHIIEKTAGKMNQFALRDENFRRNSHKKKLHEEEPFRLLIDPCKDDPEELLEFLKSGLLRPREKNGKPDEMAQYSIDVYALQREVLVKARKEKYLLVMRRIKSVDKGSEFVIQNIKENKNGESETFASEELNVAFTDLLDFLDVKKIPNEYIGLARQYIHPFLDIYSERLAGVLDASNKNEPWYGNMVTYLEPQILALKKYFSEPE